MGLHDRIFRRFKEIFKFKFKVEVETIDGWMEVDSINVTNPTSTI